MLIAAAPAIVGVHSTREPDAGTISRSVPGHVQMIPAPIAAPRFHRRMKVVAVNVGAVVKALAARVAVAATCPGSSACPSWVTAPPAPWAFARVSATFVAVAAPRETPISSIRMRRVEPLRSSAKGALAAGATVTLTAASYRLLT